VRPSTRHSLRPPFFEGASHSITRARQRRRNAEVCGIKTGTIGALSDRKQFPKIIRLISARRLGSKSAGVVVKVWDWFAFEQTGSFPIAGSPVWHCCCGFERYSGMFYGLPPLASEKRELEKRLARLRSEKVTGDNGAPRVHRKYPRVLPKYRNPNEPYETWSGRGKLPRWLAAARKTGRKVEDFAIDKPEPSKTNRRRRRV
jgi:DNA-binding protein H-NS